MSTRTSELLNNAGIAYPAHTGSRQPSDPRLQQLTASTLTWEVFSQDAVGYAGDVENARPVRPRSLYDVKKWIADYFPYAHFRAALPETTLYFAFCSNRIKLSPEEAISVPRDDLWWLAAPGDTLLLTDRRTHHYVSIHHIDAETDRIFLLDPWPDRIFLKRGLNLANVEAVVEPIVPGNDATYKLVSITRAEFLRTAVGIITRDTPDLIAAYEAHDPSARQQPRMQLAFGLALMDAESNVLAPQAARHYKLALQLTQSAQSGELATYAAARLYVALVCALHYQRLSREPLAEKPFDDMLRQLLSQQPEEQLLAQARCSELCRLGHAAGASEDYPNALRLLDIAVLRFPQEEEPWRLRAKARVLTEDHAGAVADATAALSLNQARIERLEAQRESWHPYDRFSRQQDTDLIGGLRERRVDELNLRTVALTRLGRTVEARADANALVALSPDASGAYAKLAVIEQIDGETAS
jgi:tetratricopeptide (TPR) repeat protein